MFTCQGCKGMEGHDVLSSTCCDVCREPQLSQPSACVFLLFVVFHHHLLHQHSPSLPRLTSSTKEQRHSSPEVIIWNLNPTQALLGSPETLQKIEGLNGARRSFLDSQCQMI